MKLVSFRDAAPQNEGHYHNSVKAGNHVTGHTEKVQHLYTENRMYKM